VMNSGLICKNHSNNLIKYYNQKSSSILLLSAYSPLPRLLLVYLSINLTCWSHCEQRQLNSLQICRSLKSPL